MEWLKTWGTAVCFVAAACAVLQLLVPNNGTGRVLEMICAAMVVCTMLSPLVTVNWKEVPLSLSVLTEDAKNDVLQKQYLEQLNGPLQKAVSKAGDEILKTYGLSAEKIEAVTDTDADGRIYITKIVATLTPEQAVRRLAVQKVLKERFSVEAEVVEVQKNGG